MSKKLQHNRNLCIMVVQLASLCVNSAVWAAKDCDLKAVGFDKTQEQIKKYYEFEAVEVAKIGEANLIIRSEDICKDLPKATMLKFSFINDNLIQVILERKIENAKAINSGLILAKAKESFGEIDNIDNYKNPQNKLNPIKLGLWNKNKDFTVVYSVYKKADTDYEKLIITSTNHQDEVNTVNAAKVKAIDDYLKANKLGAYSQADPGISQQDQNNKPKKSSKDFYKETILKENENSRGFHIEDKK